MRNELYLYTCKDDRKKIRKQMTLVSNGAITMHIKQPTSVINPVIIISSEHIGENWSSINYAYIPDFSRYYFVDNIECRHDGVLVLTMTVDVLYTYKTDLLNTKFMIARSEKLSDPYFIDTERAIINRRIVTYKKLGKIDQSANGKKYTITVAGGT